MTEITPSRRSWLLGLSLAVIALTMFLLGGNGDRVAADNHQFLLCSGPGETKRADDTPAQPGDYIIVVNSRNFEAITDANDQVPEDTITEDDVQSSGGSYVRSDLSWGMYIPSGYVYEEAETNTCVINLKLMMREKGQSYFKEATVEFDTSPPCHGRLWLNTTRDTSQNAEVCPSGAPAGTSGNTNQNVGNGGTPVTPDTNDPQDITPPGNENDRRPDNNGGGNNNPPVNNPPVNNPPVNNPPVNNPPVNNPPVNNPPVNNPPVNNPPVNNPPVTDPPVNNPPVTDPPNNDPPKDDPSERDTPSNDNPPNEEKRAVTSPGDTADDGSTTTVSNVGTPEQTRSGEPTSDSGRGQVRDDVSDDPGKTGRGSTADSTAASVTDDDSGSTDDKRSDASTQSTSTTEQQTGGDVSQPVEPSDDDSSADMLEGVADDSGSDDMLETEDMAETEDMLETEDMAETEDMLETEHVTAQDETQRPTVRPAVPKTGTGGVNADGVAHRWAIATGVAVAFALVVIGCMWLVYRRTGFRLD